MKLRRFVDGQDHVTIRGYSFWCPGCRMMHAYHVPEWGFNGDLERPTFTPSLLCHKDWPARRCHLFLTAGRIQYCGDCHHELRGQTVDMVELPADGSWPSGAE